MIGIEIKKVLLGIIGERIVAKALRDKGHIVEESLDPFDTEKDMTVDGQRVEVKTQVHVVIEDSFGIPRSQLKKIMGSHRVYFVSVPPAREINQDDLMGGVFELDPSSDFKMHRAMIGKNETLCIPRRQTAMRMIYQVTDPTLLSRMQDLTSSYM
jgi:hypothetical protein